MFREMNGLAVRFRLYGNWTEYVSGVMHLGPHFLATCGVYQQRAAAGVTASARNKTRFRIPKRHQGRVRGVNQRGVWEPPPHDSYSARH